MRTTLICALVLALLAPSLAPAASASHTDASLPLLAGDARVDEALAWWAGQPSTRSPYVDGDGCVHRPDDGDEASPCSTYWTKWLAATAAHVGADPASWPSPEASVLGWLKAHASDLREQRVHEDCEGASSPSDACRNARTVSRLKSVLGFAAAGIDPRSVPLPEGGSRDLVADLLETFHEGEFGHPDYVNDDVWAVIALNAAGYEGPKLQAAIDTITAAQQPSGGLAYTTGASPSVDLTASGIMALAPHEAGAFVEDAIGFLRDQQIEEGPQRACWPLRKPAIGEPTATAESTARAIHALAATRRDPLAWAVGSQDPIECLLGLRQADGGFEHVPGQGYSDPQATQQALAALAWTPYGSLQAPNEPEDASRETREDTKIRLELVPGFLRVDEARHASYTFRPSEPGTRTFHGLRWTPHAHPVELTVTVREAGSSEPAGSSSQGSVGAGGDGTPPSIPLPANLTAEREVPFTLTLNATPSDDPVIELKLDWGPGNGTGWQPDNRFTHTFHTLGNRTITAWAKDADGDVARAEAALSVVDAVPRVTIDGPRKVNRTEPATFEAEARDPDGPPPEIRWSAAGETGEGLQEAFRFRAPGEHTVQAVAVDEAGNRGRAAWTVVAPNRPPANVTVRPARVPANETVVLTAHGEDPDGDELRFAWRSPGSKAPSSWGAQRHLETGAPGQRTLIVNASDPYGGWSRVRVVVQITEQAPMDEEGHAARALARASSPLPTVPEPTPEPPASPLAPTLELPRRVQAEANRTSLLEGTARDPDGRVADVTVALGGPLPVRGTETFTARLPGLPPGTYELTAHAVDEAGNRGPARNLTLVVEDATQQEPVEPTTSTAPGERLERASPGPGLGLLVALAALALLIRRGKR